VIVRDNKPGLPPHGTVRTDRRSRGSLAPAQAWPSEEAVECRTGVPRSRPVLPGACGGHHWLQMCSGRQGHLLPHLPRQPGYHKRLRAAAPLICATMQYLATLRLSWARDLRVIDATLVPCGTSRQTVQRSELAGWANYGYCATHSRWCWEAVPGSAPPTACRWRASWPTPRSASARPQRSCPATPATREARPDDHPGGQGLWPGGASSTWTDTAAASRRSVCTRRTTTPRHGLLHLAQLDRQHNQQAIPDRLRPLIVRSYSSRGYAITEFRQRGERCPKRRRRLAE
jgi:hypothetical protein